MTEGIDRSDEMLEWYAEDHIDGTELLDDLHDMLTRYVVFPDEHASAAVALYIAATHAQPAWEHATRLVIKSPLKRCGKSRLQEIIAETCHRPLRTANCSTAALVRSIGSDDPPTILLDEADTVFGGRKAAKDSVAEDLRGFINAGHSRGAPYLRWDMNSRQLETCPTFAMAVLGGIGDMPDTIEDRAVVVAMRRRASGETVDQFRRRSIPALHALRDRLATWIREHLGELRTAEPAMPVQDRAADTWEPLVAVADLAGGAWPERARAACTAMTGGAADDPDSAGERLLADLYELWGDEPAVSTADLLDRLHKLDESPWADWYGKPLTDRGLANLLRPYGVRSRNVKIGGAVPKGYRREDLADPWSRYVPRTPCRYRRYSATCQRDIRHHQRGRGSG
ncbi:DUF3631 domain-containing protein [Mycolicibacterium novocastrense]|nr:DUF3631 domain-containing protein [Mycolicibacterium novocastrense]